MVLSNFKQQPLPHARVPEVLILEDPSGLHVFLRLADFGIFHHEEVPDAQFSVSPEEINGQIFI
jgi:hypothetical protein